MGTNIFKRIGVILITAVIFAAVIAPCFDLGEKDVYAWINRRHSAFHHFLELFQDRYFSPCEGGIPLFGWLLGV